MVVIVGPAFPNHNQLITESTGSWMVAFPNSDPGKVTIEVNDSAVGLESSSRLQWWDCTLELGKRIGHHSLKILVDSSWIGNYINTQECIVRNLEVGEEEFVEEFTIVDGSLVRTLGRVLVISHCGVYRGGVYARIFPQMNKQGNDSWDPIACKGKFPNWLDSNRSGS